MGKRKTSSVNKSSNVSMPEKSGVLIEYCFRRNTIFTLSCREQQITTDYGLLEKRSTFMGIFNKLYSLGIRLKGNTEYLSYGRDVVSDFIKEYTRSLGLQKIKVLDIGCGSGDDLIRVSDVSVQNVIFTVLSFMSHIASDAVRGG